LSLCTGQETSIVPPAWCVRIFCFSLKRSSTREAGTQGVISTYYHFSTYSHRRDAASCGDHAPFPYLSTARPRPSHTQTMTKTHRTRHRHMQEINNKARGFFRRGWPGATGRPCCHNACMQLCPPRERRRHNQNSSCISNMREHQRSPKHGGSRARREKKPITRRRTSSSSSSSCPLGCHWTAPAARPPPPGPPRHLPRW
jgi:hypothetical protein